MLQSIKVKKRAAPASVPVVAHDDAWYRDHYTGIEEHTLDEIQQAAANSNLAMSSDITRDEAIKCLRALGYCTILTNKNAGTFRVMKS